MKTWKVVFWRSNPQFTKGGYETTRTIEARTANSARNKAEKKYGKCIYGGMEVLRVEEVKA